jgi:uncharacterized protein YbjT (DUF2867 family)
MLVAVSGATGTVGRRVVAELVARGHEVRQLSRRPPDRAMPGTSHRSIDLATGAGLTDALAGADAVVDAANTVPSSRQATAVLVEGTRRLSAAAVAAGVHHHVLISIVGIDDVPTAYYRAKVAQERVLVEGGTPWSIVRATQFHALLHQVFSLTARVRLLPAPRFALQPIDAATVAGVLAGAVEAGPSGGRVDVAGPVVADVGELARQWRAVTGRHALLAPVPVPGAVGRALRRGALTAPHATRASGPTFEAWLRG